MSYSLFLFLEAKKSKVKVSNQCRLAFPMIFLQLCQIVTRKKHDSYSRNKIVGPQMCFYFSILCHYWITICSLIICRYF
uniref:Uncharacterized protein n=1 Tax=Rhizophora mucronata TaxID=61149 RepID=A0A2P2QGX5_RHIMU